MIGRLLAELAGRGRRVPRQGLLTLTSKRAPRNFYKGKGVKSTGRHTRKGAMRASWSRLPNLRSRRCSHTELCRSF